MHLNVLLVNPNTVKSPPVIPIGLEYLKTALEKNEIKVEILDLCFNSSQEEELENQLNENSYDIVGITVRNIDSSLYYNNEFYLPAIKNLVQCAKKHEIPVILGGSGFSAMPQEILEYLDADYGIIGPGEVIFPEFLKRWASKELNEKTFNGWHYGLDDELVHFRGGDIDYKQYISEEGIVGFRTHVGCQNHCPYCIEANKKIILEKIPNIITEISHLVDQGYNHFHLCDSEFNNDLEYSIEFCKALIESKNQLKWTLYMKPTPYSEELFRLLSETNAYLITLTVDSYEQIQVQNKYSYADLAEIINYCNKYGIQLAIDLLTGYPLESLESTKKVIKFFQENRPTRVGIGFYYRVANHTTLAELIKNDEALRKYLTRKYSKGEKFLEPIFFSQYTQEMIEELIAGDDLFSISGLTPGVNYQQNEINK